MLMGLSVVLRISGKVLDKLILFFSELLKFILWELQMPVQSVMIIRLVVVEILQSGPNW